MGLFHVWFKFYGPNRHVHQRIVTFVNREAADEWWRTISTQGFHDRCVERMSPQFYVQTSGTDIFYFFNDGHPPDTTHLSKGMFLAAYMGESGDAKAIFMPSTEIVDHISGRWYFIRSKADPFSHWYLRTSGRCVVCENANCDAIHVSSDHRTRFCLRVRNHPGAPEDFVMIGKDEISIAAPKGYTVHINDGGDLTATKGYEGEIDLLFGDLKNRFLTRAERQINGEVWEYVESVERGVGEVWELVE